MAETKDRLIVLFDARDDARAAIADGLDGIAVPVYLSEAAEGERAGLLANAGAVLARNTDRELRDDECDLIAGARLLQFVSAGVDFIRLDRLPDGLPIACNAGAYAEPMAEHGIAMALAAAKRLLPEHCNMRAGQFNQFTVNRMLRGGVCGIIGFGGVGRATARLARGLGMRVMAINRRGATDEPVDFIGPPAALDEVLDAADVLVIATPLTRSTRGLIGAPELTRMRPDAIIVNLARGEIIDEAALYAHLQRHPDVTACIDAWWVEPIRHGEFRMDHPFLDLPNVIASPHNSASVPGASAAGLRQAAENVRRALAGEPPRHLVTPDDRLA